MARFTDIEEKLQKTISDDRLKTNLRRIREAMEDIWSADAPRIIQGFTHHGVEHSERLAGFAHKLLEWNRGDDLSEEEMYLLLAGIYLHDIGMQCDVVKYPKIREMAEELGAQFDVEFTIHAATEYPIEEQKAIRQNHQYLTAAWIEYARSFDDTVLGGGAKYIPDDLVDDLMDVCKYHSKLSILDCPLTFKFDHGRKQLVAALLRFSDELDVDMHRVSLETARNFSISPDQSVYWWLHHLTKISFSHNIITITIRLHPDDAKEYDSFVHRTFIDGFRNKNESLLKILQQQNIHIAISADSGVKINKHGKKVPADIAHILKDKLTRDNILYYESLAETMGMTIVDSNLYEHITDMANNLEKKVEERTQELISANEDLAAFNEQFMAMNEELISAKKESTMANDALVIAHKEILEVDRLKSEFLNSMTHELRTPLTSIIGYSALLTKNLVGDLNTKQAEYANGILRSGNYLLGLINEILDLSKIEAGRMKIISENVNVLPVIEDVIMSQRPMIDGNHHIVTIDVAKDVYPINVDKIRVKQILMNVINNAIKFTDDGGHITVKSYNKGNNVCIDVVDTGIGINEEDIPKLFKRFSQIDQKLSRQYAGTGLGLAIAREFIELMGGSIYVESAYGEGSTFRLVFPAYSEA